MATFIGYNIMICQEKKPIFLWPQILAANEVNIALYQYVSKILGQLMGGRSVLSLKYYSVKQFLCF
jgi:hypothetical protein